MSYDLTPTLDVLLSRLGASSLADLTWCTPAEVYGWFNEAGLRLANFGLFVDITIVPNAPATIQLGNWLETLHVSFGGTKLRPSGVSELKALDPGWQTTVCATGAIPTRYTLDAAGFGVLTLYPAPYGSAGECEHISAQMPPVLFNGTTLAPIPSVLADYFLYVCIWKARGKESDYSMPEVAAYAMKRLGLLDAVIKAYWGAK